MSKRERNQECTIYIGNLDANVTESLLYELFVQVAPIAAIHFPKDRILKTHQGYGFIEFESSRDVEYAEKVMQGIKLFNKILKINKVGAASVKNRDLEIGATLFVNNLDDLVDENLLSTIFQQFGPFHRKPEIKKKANSEGSYALIHYKNFNDSDKALAKMQNQFILDKKISIDYALKKNSKGSKTTKHGDETERLLLEKAKQNNYQL
ncbi:hypothetical protein WICMUC_003617 [Wickerhamomyces mucosus]|uniref:RRM domain-containing protein n=1 Tax=Wickerhamomyces mucosus TaxID=1378264 RepID=A0A9P8PK56_9ASCO|nr:hypothetical protein WICMUC_003617 [Wickerhamomyces mucosus]